MDWKRGIIWAVTGTALLVSGCSEVVKPEPVKQTQVTPVETDGIQKTEISEIDLAKAGVKLDQISEKKSLSPAGNLLALTGIKFANEQTGKPLAAQEAYLLSVNLKSGDVTVLDKGKFLDVIQWSADNKKVLYMKDENLCVLDISSKRPVELGQSAYYGAISPDGTKVAYTVRGKGLFLANIDSTDKIQLTNKKGDWYPVWYPDGVNLFYFNDRGVNLGDGAGQLQGLAKINTHTGKITELLPGETGKYRKATWLVAGKALHINKGWDDGYYELVVNLEKGKITDLGENFEMAYATTVDLGRGLLFKAAKDKVVTLDADGHEINQFAVKNPVEDRLVGNFGYAVSLDGKNLAYCFGEIGYGASTKIKGRKICTVGVDGQGFKELTKDYGDYQTPLWLPDNEHVVTVETQMSGPTKAGKLLIRILPIK